MNFAAGMLGLKCGDDDEVLGSVTNFCNSLLARIQSRDYGKIQEEMLEVAQKQTTENFIITTEPGNPFSPILETFRGHAEPFLPQAAAFHFCVNLVCVHNCRTILLGMMSI